MLSYLYKYELETWRVLYIDLLLDSMGDPCNWHVLSLTDLISDWNYRIQDDIKIELYYLMVTIASQEHNT